MRLPLPARVVERLALLRTRAAIPAGVFVGLAFIGFLLDVWDGVTFVWRSVRAVPWLGWLASPVGFLILAVLWISWLLGRSSSGDAAVQVARVRALLRDAAAVLRASADHPAPPGTNESLSGSYRFMQLLGLLDDAFVPAERHEILRISAIHGVRNIRLFAPPLVARTVLIAIST